MLCAASVVARHSSLVSLESMGLKDLRSGNLVTLALAQARRASASTSHGLTLSQSTCSKVVPHPNAILLDGETTREENLNSGSTTASFSGPAATEDETTMIARSEFNDTMLRSVSGVQEAHATLPAVVPPDYGLDNGAGRRAVPAHGSLTVPVMLRKDGSRANLASIRAMRRPSQITNPPVLQ